MEISLAKVILRPLTKSPLEDQIPSNRNAFAIKEEIQSSNEIEKGFISQSKEEQPASISNKSLTTLQTSTSSLTQTISKQSKSEKFRITTRRSNSQVANTKNTQVAEPKKIIRMSTNKNLDYKDKENRREKSDKQNFPKDKFISSVQSKITAQSCSSVPEPKERTDTLNDYFDDLPEVEEEVEFDDEQTPESKVSKKKKKKRFTLLKDMVPLNLEEERKKFFELAYNYNPQFNYKIETLKQKFEEPHSKYLKIAENILNKCIIDFGDDETYIEKTGGRICSQEEIEAQFSKYVQELGLEKRLKLVFSENIVIFINLFALILYL